MLALKPNKLPQSQGLISELKKSFKEVSDSSKMAVNSCNNGSPKNAIQATPSINPSVDRGRKPQPMQKPRPGTKPPPLPRKPPKSALSNSTGNSPDTSRSNSPHTPHNVLNRSHSPNIIKSRSPSPKPPLPKKPGLPAKPPKPSTLALTPPKKTEDKPETSLVVRDKSAANMSLKRISPMNPSFTTEDLDLLHKPSEDTVKTSPDLKRNDETPTSQQRAVKKDKRRSKSVGAPAFLDLLEQIQAKNATNGVPKRQSMLRRSQTAEESKIAEKSKEEDASSSESSSKTNLPESEQAAKLRPSYLQTRQSSLVDNPGNTPPALSKNMVVMDIDIDKADTPKRPPNPPSVNTKTSPCRKPGVPSKPKALPPKPVFKKSDSTTSFKDEPSVSQGSKDSKLKEEESCKAKICDKENLQTKNTSSPAPVSSVRSKSEKTKGSEFGSVEKLKDNKVKKKKKSFSERFSMRKSNTPSCSSVFYSDIGDNATDIGMASKFYVSDELGSVGGSVNNNSMQSVEDVKCGKDQENRIVNTQTTDKGDVCANEKKDNAAKKTEKVHELVKFNSLEGEEPTLMSESAQNDRAATPEVHYYETVENNNEQNTHESSHPKPPSPPEGDFNLECADSDDLQDALDRAVKVLDDFEMSSVQIEPPNESYNEDDFKIYDNNFRAVEERRSARSKKASESRSEVESSEGVKPRYVNMESVDGEHVDSETESEYSDGSFCSYDSDDIDGESQMSQTVLEESTIEPQNKVKNIAKELCTTEKAYVGKLKLVDQVFQNRIISENRTHHMFPDNVIPQMFSNIKSIYQFHNDFLLVQLEKRMQQWDETPKIGDLMKRFAPFLKLYTDYVQNYDNARNVINLWLQKSPKFASIIEEIQKSPECGFLTLQHHMLEPVQRVPRYELLLKQYINHLPEDSDDKEDSEEALRLVSTAASHSNEAMAKLDKFRKLWAVNESLGGAIDLMNPTLELMKEGRVIKISQRNAVQNERYLFLFSEMLLVCRTMPVAIGAMQYKVKDELGLDGMHVLEGDNLITPNTFYVKSKEKSMEFHFASHEEKTEWHVAILNTVSLYARRLSVHQPTVNIAENFQETALGLRAPTWIKDQETSMCMLCSSSFTKITRRRHHCRACGIVICGKCSSHSVKLPYDDNKLNRVCDKCFGILSGGKLPLSKSESAANTKKTVLQVKATEKSLKSGYMQMSQDKKSWQKRWFAARDDFVLYSFKAHQDVLALTSMPLPGYEVQDDEDDGKKLVKLFRRNQKTYYFQAEDNTLAGWKTVLSALAKAEIPDSVV